MFNQIKYIYFIGIGGIGMSALARYFKAMGKDVSGYDKTDTILTQELVSEGIEIHYEDNIKKIFPAIISPERKDDVLVIYTPAVPKDHSELNYFQSEGFQMRKRAEVLGMITKNTATVAVAGTHGKTTTSSLIAHIFKNASVDSAAFLGGILKNYNSNLLLGKENKITVVEADEYDRSFLTLYPDVAIITSVDPDHLDIYKNPNSLIESFTLFSEQVKEKGTLIYKTGLKANFSKSKAVKLTYSLSDTAADYYCTEVNILKGEYHYSVVTPKGIISNITLGIPGLHNVENSIAAIAASQAMGISDAAIRNGLKSFEGVKRRFDYQVKTDDLIYIDDYAHHPEELKACIGSVKQLYPGKKVTGIFQPHLFSRTKDFADEFAISLELLDEVILLDIYPARELPMPGIDSRMLLDKIKKDTKVLVSKEDLLNELKKRNVEVLLTVGAGDIDQLVEPIKKLMEEKMRGKK